MSLWRAFCEIMSARNYQLTRHDKVLDNDEVEVQEIAKMNEDLERLELKSRYRLESSLLASYRRYSEGYISRLANMAPCMQHNVVFVPDPADSTLIVGRKGMEYIHALNFSLGRQLSPRAGNQLTQLSLVNEALYAAGCEFVFIQDKEQIHAIATQERLATFAG